MVIVPIGTAYVDANFKESQFGDIRIGQPVELTSDYYGGDVVYRGKVVGIAGGTGAAFSLIPAQRSEEHTSELQSLMRISYAVFCLKKKNTTKTQPLQQ